MEMSSSRVGIWSIGAKGGVASTAIVGLAALRRGLAGSQGLVSQLPQFQHLGLADWDQFVVAGHDIRRVSLVDEARRLVTESRTVSAELFEQCRGRARPG